MARPARSTQGDADARLCSCPVRDGMIYHLRSACTDPVVIRLDVYAADMDDVHV